MPHAFTRSGTAPFKTLVQLQEETSDVELGGESTDSYSIFPNAASTELVESASWAEIEDALIGESEVADTPNVALQSHEVAEGYRSMLLARSEQGLMLVDDRPLGTDDDHQMAEDLAADVIDVLAAVNLTDGDLVLLSARLAYVLVVDGLWIHLLVMPCTSIGKALSRIESIREAAHE